MFGNIFDPFSNISDANPVFPDVTPGVHIGVVKGYNSATKSCMVLVSSVNDTEALGPMRIVKPVHHGNINEPEIGDVVVVAFLDGKFNNAVVLGTLA